MALNLSTCQPAGSKNPRVQKSLRITFVFRPLARKVGSVLDPWRYFSPPEWKVRHAIYCTFEVTKLSSPNRLRLCPTALLHRSATCWLATLSSSCRSAALMSPCLVVLVSRSSSTPMLPRRCKEPKPIRLSVYREREAIFLNLLFTRKQILATFELPRIRSFPE